MIEWMLGVIILLIVLVCVFIVLKRILKTKYEENDGSHTGEEYFVLPKDRLEAIKDKYKKTRHIKKTKNATKEDVEKFYESQRNFVNKKDNKNEE